MKVVVTQAPQERNDRVFLDMHPFVTLNFVAIHIAKQK